MINVDVKQYHKLAYGAIKLLLVLLHLPILLYSQPQYYHSAHDEMLAMMEGKQPTSFKRAVFLVENAWYNDSLSYTNLCNNITKLATLTKGHASANDLPSYAMPDKPQVHLHAALFHVMTDTIRTIMRDRSMVLQPPYRYNFDDFAGERDWSNMFVSRLLYTHLGNCHSLPYLYKLVADELGLKTYLSVAPNHTYIKLRNQGMGWYNVELTSGNFPYDSWLMASGYIHTDAIRNGIYMDTIGTRRAIALCLLDLAQGYQRKFGVDSSAFVLQCCDEALKYIPNCINAMLMKTETLKKQFEATAKKSRPQYSPEAKAIFNQMEQLYGQIYRLGYRQMPIEMYQKWLAELETEKAKYQNQRVKAMIR